MLHASIIRMNENALLHLFAVVRQAERSVDRICGGMSLCKLDFVENGIIVVPVPPPDLSGPWNDLRAWYSENNRIDALTAVAQQQIVIDEKSLVVSVEEWREALSRLRELPSILEKEQMPSKDWLLQARISFSLIERVLEPHIKDSARLARAKHVEHFLDPLHKKMYELSEI